jgi:hypothetical protein
LKYNELRIQHEVASLDQQASSYLKENGTTSVVQLYDLLRIKNLALNEEDVTDLVWRLVEAGQADVEDVPPAAKSLNQYLGIWERNLWFYTSVAVSLMTVLVVYTVPAQFPLVVLRWVLGSVFVLFMPGYVTVEALFPKSSELDGIERFALSLGLSLALVPLIGVLLNYTSWGIGLTPIVIALAAFTVGLSLLGLERRFRLSVQKSAAADIQQEPEPKSEASKQATSKAGD